MRSLVPFALLLWVTLALTAAASFVLQTAVVPHASSVQLVLAVAVCAALFLGLRGGIPRPREVRALGARDAALIVGAGALGGMAAPALVVANRASDVPPGAVVAFWTLAVWGALFLLAGAVLSRAPVRAAAALIGVAGAMGVLGNWERPSSFSLLVRYPDREVAMVFAGALFVLAVLTLARLAERHGRRPVYVLAGAGGIAAALAWGLFYTGTGTTGLASLATVLPYGAAGGLMFALAIDATRTIGPHVTGTALIAGPPLVTALLFVEEATEVFGPRPVILETAGWATVVIGAALLVALAPDRGAAHGTPGGERARYERAGALFALVPVACAVASMALPGVAVAVTGRTAEGAAFSAEFVLGAFRTTGGWLALALAVLALAAWAAPLGRRAAWLLALAGASAAAAYPAVRFTPLQTWISWIPPEVQHDYGTEYANIVFAPVGAPVQGAAVVLACVMLIARVAYPARTRPGAR